MASSTEAKTLVKVLENGAADHPALVAPDGPTITYDSLRKQVARLMVQLKSFGIRREDRVAIVLPNGIEMIVSFLAVASVATAASVRGWSGGRRTSRCAAGGCRTGRR